MVTIMKWQGINEFVAVAETQSFTLAAKKLKISTAQVSRQISALEKRLNIKLFKRSTRNVSLNHEAKLYYQHCRNLLAGLDAAEQAITHLQSTPKGTIKLSAPVTYGEQKILPLVNDFVQLYSEIEVVSELTNNRVDLVNQFLVFIVNATNSGSIFVTPFDQGHQAAPVGLLSL